ncbi:MAG TPA: hypothetical protein VIC85_03290 [Ktedonobacterales bacterium]|jgi:hypothetical protein
MADSTIVTKIYEQIPLEGMQQVSDSYMAWYVDRVTRQLDETMSNLRAELRDNDQKEASYRPSPQELESIERLQRSGVTGVDLLDRMVEQGEDWLLVSMRRLDHFERTGLAPKDYSTWCEHALSGAYDWIDHERLGGSGGGMPRGGAPTGGPKPAAVPDWLAGRQGSRGEERPTAPVPSVAQAPKPGDPAWGNGQAAGRPAPQADGADGDGRRNIFRIFTN